MRPLKKIIENKGYKAHIKLGPLKKINKKMFGATRKLFSGNIRARFRSWDLWVMGPPRFRCATLILLIA